MFYRWLSQLRTYVLQKLYLQLEQRDAEFFWHRPITVKVIDIRPMDMIRTLAPVETRMLINAGFDLATQQKLFDMLKHNLESSQPLEYLHTTMEAKI